VIVGLPRRDYDVMRRWAWVIAISTVAGALYGARIGGVLIGAATGGLTGGLLSFLEIFVFGGWARRALSSLPFAVYFALRVVIYVTTIVAVDLAVTGLAGRNSITDNLARGDFGFSIVMSVGANLLFGVNNLLGPGVLFAFVAGRYRRPRREVRVLLYIDLCGSTTLTEKLGEMKFMDLLNAFFADVTGEIVAEGGEIHKYVGDEVIAVWRAGTDPARPIRACLAARRRIARRTAYYLSAFGVTPDFRAAIHEGAVVIGELGEQKKEIALIGDAMNTAARILEAARETGAAVLISAPFYASMRAPPAGLSIRRLAPVALRGKSAPLELISLAEQGDALPEAIGPI